jgi:2-polyprenyl-6-methoxyphenol hydroxylase-like FAD-dependent oxidoreductase
LHDAGAVPFNFGTDLKFRTYYGWGVRPFGDYPGHRCTRALLEACVRRRVREQPNIEFVPKTIAKHLETRNGAVVGIKTNNGDLHGDLVVEASGKASKMEQWMTDLGYALPEPTVVDGLVGYGTQMFKIPPGERDWRALVIQPAPAKPGGSRGGSLFPVEGGHWQVTVTGFGGDYPPTKPADYLEYLRSFRVPAIYEAVRDAEPVTGVYGSRSTENRHLHLERAKAWPRGFLVVGDAAVHLNPVYAQGMSLSAMAGEALAGCLAGGDDRLPERFYVALDRVVKGAWTLATSVDLQVKGHVGSPPPPGFSVMTFYMDRLMQLVPRHYPTARRFAKVLHLLRPPSSLVAPSVLAQVLLPRRLGATDGGS